MNADVKLPRSNRSASLTVTVWALTLATACGSRQGDAVAESGATRATWLGSAAEWGLLGLARDGGSLAYRRAEDLQSPTWAPPPELPAVSDVWPAGEAIWARLVPGRIARFDMRSGHVLDFSDFPPIAAGVALESDAGLFLAESAGTLRRVGLPEPWHVELPGAAARLENAGDGRIVALVGDGMQRELTVWLPPDRTPVGRRVVGRLRDMVIAPWGEQLYYVSGGADDAAIHTLTLPALDAGNDISLPEPGQAIAVTPSGHRLYVAAGDSLYVFDRVAGRRVRCVALPGPAAALRFGVNGAVLLAQIAGERRTVVVQVGLDSLLGEIASDWDEHLPVALPGNRLVARLGRELVLYSTPELAEIARVQTELERLWIAVEWQPPRPRPELARRVTRPTPPAGGPSDTEGAVEPEAPAAEPVRSALSAGYYAVVSAARQRAGVDRLASWLSTVGFPAVVQEHEDPTGAVWYRAMVGPYAERAGAEEAAASLAGRYGYKPWILTADSTGNARADSAVAEESAEGA